MLLLGVLLVLFVLLTVFVLPIGFVFVGLLFELKKLIFVVLGEGFDPPLVCCALVFELIEFVGGLFAMFGVLF